MITWMAMVSSRDRPREGARGAQRTYRGGPEKGYRGEPALQGGHGSTGVTRLDLLYRCFCDFNHLLQ